MKKRYLFVLTLLFMIPFMVKADEKPKVLTLETETDGSIITYSGTMESGSHAVMCKLYDNEDKEVAMLSSDVDGGAFEGEFVAPKTGDYYVACANYEGGLIETADVSVTVITTFKVEFNTNGGGTIADATVEAGHTVEKPADPEKEGFTFGGWYEDATFNIAFDFDKKITADTVLYAKWTEATVVVHTVFFGEGGTYIVEFDTDDPDNQGPMEAPINNSAFYSVVVGREMTLTAVPATSYRFKGWYEGNVDAQKPEDWPTNVLLSDNVVYKFVPTGTPYIVPVFEKITHKVTFNTNGGSDVEEADIDDNDVVVRPPDPEKDGFIFGGWYEDETLNAEYDFNTPVTDNLVLYAKWDEIEEGEDPNANKDKEYTVSDGTNSIIFNEAEGHEFTLVIIDIMSLTDEELAEFDISREAYNEVEKRLAAAVKENGTLLAFYDIVVIDENDEPVEDGPFTIKIRITPEMEKYNSFKIIYVDIDDELNIEVEKVITLEAKDGYLVGTLPHLSNYVLVGDNVETTNNPKTFDNIYIWIIALLVSTIGLVFGTIMTKRVKKEKVR